MAIESKNVLNQKTDQDAIEKAIDEPTDYPIRDEKGNRLCIQEETVSDELTPRQKRFCELYALDKEFFGNGVVSYLEVYDIDTEKPGWYKSACSAASRLLGNVKVYTYINRLLEESGLNDQFVDKQILFLISQQANLSAKLAAIQEYNKLKKRITNKIEHSGQVEIGSILKEIQGMK